MIPLLNPDPVFVPLLLLAVTPGMVGNPREFEPPNRPASPLESPCPSNFLYF